MSHLKADKRHANASKATHTHTHRDEKRKASKSSGGEVPHSLIMRATSRGPRRHRKIAVHHPPGLEHIGNATLPSARACPPPSWAPNQRRRRNAAWAPCCLERPRWSDTTNSTIPIRPCEAPHHTTPERVFPHATFLAQASPIQAPHPGTHRSAIKTPPPPTLLRTHEHTTRATHHRCGPRYTPTMRTSERTTHS